MSSSSNTIKAGSRVVFVPDNGQPPNTDDIGRVIQYPAENPDGVPCHSLAWVDFGGDADLIDIDALRVVPEPMSDDEWITLSQAADILEHYGYTAESVAVFTITQHHQ